MAFAKTGAGKLKGEVKPEEIKKVKEVKKEVTETVTPKVREKADGESV